MTRYLLDAHSAQESDLNPHCATQDPMQRKCGNPLAVSCKFRTVTNSGPLTCTHSVARLATRSCPEWLGVGCTTFNPRVSSETGMLNAASPRRGGYSRSYVLNKRRSA